MPGPAPLVQTESLLILGVLSLLLAGTGLRVLDLDNRLNIDAFLWLARTAIFWRNVEAGDWHGTFQSTHPGVTFMWLTGASMKAFGSVPSGYDTLGWGDAIQEVGLWLRQKHGDPVPAVYPNRGYALTIIALPLTPRGGGTG